MRHLVTAFFFIVITLTSYSQTQLELNRIASEKYSKADIELNRVYTEILTDYKEDSNFVEKLRISQRLWIKFRDSELDMKFPESDKKMNYGSIYPVCKYQYLEQLTNERTEKLMEWLKPIPEGESCVGSIKYR